MTQQEHFQAAHQAAKEVALTPPVLKHEAISRMCAHLLAALNKGK